MKQVHTFFLVLTLTASFHAAQPVRAQNAYEEDAGAAYDLADDLSLDALQRSLPEHLRTPLPFKAKTPSKATDYSADAYNADAATPPADAATPVSAIEQYYRDVTGHPTLTQYGYGFFGDPRNADVPAAGTVQDDYILGAGDRVTVAFLGERKDKGVYVIDSSGALSIDLMPPIVAAGKTLGELRRQVRGMLDLQAYHGDAYLSLESVRQLGVLVAGHVATPGRQSITALQTVLEAIENAGGVLKSGSMRQIRLVRGGKTEIIDLYEIIGSQNKESNMPQLRDGDRIIVPSLGPTIAITGDVRQPAIYELPKAASITVEEGIALAGGFLARGQNRIIVMTPQANGQRVSQIVSAQSGFMAGDGTVLDIARTDDLISESFRLSGETRREGVFPIASYPKLSKILSQAETFGDDVYPLMGVVKRRDKRTLAYSLVAFSPQDIHAGRADLPIEDADQVMLLSRADIHAALNNKTGIMDPLVAAFIREHAVSVQGAVRLAGAWPVAGPVSIEKLLDMAGGPMRDSDLTRVEISRNDAGLVDVSLSAVPRRDVVNLTEAGAEQLTVTFGDAVRVPERFEAVTRQAVTLYGEVRNPGTYDLMRGDTLLSLIERAGGLTDEAYPLGTVFSRASERHREKEKFTAAARDMERAIALAADNKDGKVDMAQIALAKELAADLKTVETVGRITVEGDPEVLRRDPAQDILLEAGDKVYVPKRPLAVRVTGEVLSPAALQFKADKKTSDYIAEAGGLTHHADKGRMFVLHPNGAAQPLSASSWTSFKPVMITPGSTIVVPRDPKPFDFIESAKDITQILSNLAITGIYAEDLVDRN